MLASELNYLSPAAMRKLRKANSTSTMWQIAKAIERPHANDFNRVATFFSFAREPYNFNMQMVERLERKTGIRKRVAEITGIKTWRVSLGDYNEQTLASPPNYLHELAHWCVATNSQLEQFFEWHLTKNQGTCKINAIPRTSDNFNEELTVAWETVVCHIFGWTGCKYSNNSSPARNSEQSDKRLLEVGIDIANNIWLPPVNDCYIFAQDFWCKRKI